MSKYYKAEDMENLIINIAPDGEVFELGMSALQSLPTIDIVECEECRWRDVCSQVVSDIGCEVDTLLRWCSDGERKDNE